MVRRKHKIWSLLGWILGGFIALIIVITVGFYLGRGFILKRALVYLNDNKPGEVQMGQMNLIPLMDFPDVVLQVRDLSWYEEEVRVDSLHQEPILYLSELYVSMDIIELIRGDLEIAQLRLKNGFVRVEVDLDSVMNLEHALGIRFGEESMEEPALSDSTHFIDVDEIKLSNILALYHDQSSGDRVNIQINQLESQFSYLPGLIDSEIKLNVDINQIKYQTFSLEKKDSVQFISHVLVDPINRNVEVKPSSLSLSGLELETWGMYEYLGEPGINMAFRATNTGLDVLNFLFLGVLDLDEIEQIGSGSIHLDGSVTGSLGEQLPVIRVNGSAHQIGFRIKSIKRDVTDISFSMFVSNGEKSDFSESQLELKNFTASFPEGNLRGNVRAKNLVTPEVDLEMKGEMELAGLDQILDLENLKNLEGHIQLDCDLEGVVDRNSDEFLDKAGSVSLVMEGVGAVYGLDTIYGMDGELYMEGNMVGSQGLDLTFNGNRAEIEVKVENILHYFLGFRRNVNLEMSLSSERIMPGRITRDSMISGVLGRELSGLHFNAGACITSDELDAYKEHDALPEFEFTLDSFRLDLPLYADISNVNTSLTFDTDTLAVHYLNGMIGESAFSFSGRMLNLEGLLGEDSGEVVRLEYALSSELLRAEDLLNYKSDFLLPDSYQTEYMENFQLSGSLSVPIEAIASDSSDLDLDLEVTDLGWKFRYYPNAFDQFRIEARKKGNELIIDKLEGSVGESNLKLNALLGNYADSTLESLYGYMVLESDLLDLNYLLDYQLQGEEIEGPVENSSITSGSDSIEKMEFPNFNFKLDIGELRYGGNTFFGLSGALRSTTEKVLYMENLVVSGESGGSLGIKGQFNLANSLFYNLSAELEMKDVNINDLNFEMQSGEEVYTLKENFAGVVSGSGLAEVYFTPDFRPDMENTTVLFQMEMKDGALINFTPLEAAGKFLDNKDLDNVRFSTLRNSFTLMDSRIIIPLMIVESTVGQMLIEGEQGLDNTYLYLLRVPAWLVKDAAKSAISNSKDDGEEDEIKKMKMGKFMPMTIWSDGVESGVELKDQREKYR